MRCCEALRDPPLIVVTGARHLVVNTCVVKWMDGGLRLQRQTGPGACVSNTPNKYIRQHA